MARERELMKIPFGPVHPAVKEPVKLTLFVDGEEVVDASIELGYVHRGIEALAETRNLIQVLHLVERVCGICSHAHPLCFIQAIENIGGVEPPERALYIRSLVAELERIQSHLMWLGVMGYQVGLVTLFMYALRVREEILNLLEEFTGNRIIKEINTIGGVRRDLGERLIAKMKRTARELRRSLKLLAEAVYDKTLESRMEGVGILERSDAVELCAVGPVARASGVDFDVRRDDPYAAYGQLRGRFTVVVRRGGDALDRTEVRILEVLESLELVEAILDELPPGEVKVGKPLLRLAREIPAGEDVSRVEAPRGELLYYVKTDGKEFLHRLRIRTPTLANLPALRVMLRGSELADVPVILSSIDPCIACAERVTLVDARRGVCESVSLGELGRGGR